MVRARAGSRTTANVPSGARIACVVSDYHREVTDGMRDAAREELLGAGLAPRDWIEVRVPGAYELPLVARALARRADVNAVLALGLVLKGETDHDRHIASAVSHALLEASLETDTPILFGVLTCATLEQALARSRRAGHGGSDKGAEVARAAIDVLHALDACRAPGVPSADGRARARNARGRRARAGRAR